MLPALTRFYGLPPREFEHMTFDELDAYLGHYRAEMKRLEAGGGT